MALRRLNKGTQISCKLFNQHMDNWEYAVLSFGTLLNGSYMGGSKSPEFSLAEITTLLAFAEIDCTVCSKLEQVEICYCAVNSCAVEMCCQRLLHRLSLSSG